MGTPPEESGCNPERPGPVYDVENVNPHVAMALRITDTARVARKMPPSRMAGAAGGALKAK